MLKQHSALTDSNGETVNGRARHASIKTASPCQHCCSTPRACLLTAKVTITVARRVQCSMKRPIHHYTAAPCSGAQTLRSLLQ
jgi:hypothetical protein